MENKEIKGVLFDSYVTNMYNLINRYKRDFNHCRERFGDYTSAVLKENLNEIFNLYRRMLANLNLDGFNNRNLFRTPTEEESKSYKCSLDNDKNDFPLVAILEYRNCKFPEYIDDYGMESFIEISDSDGKMIQIRTNEVDWDYELDKILDVERLSKLSYEDACTLMLSDPWFKNSMWGY